MSELRPPRYLKSMNRVVKAMQRLGVHTGPAMILTVPGRKTGKARSTPMTPFTYRGDMYTVAGYPGADWAKMPGPPVKAPVAWAHVARNQDRRARRGGVTAGTARVSGAGSRRRRLRQTLRARAGRDAGRVRSARRTIGCVPVRPDELARYVGRRPLHADVAGTGFHPYVRVSSPSAGPPVGCRLFRTSPECSAGPLSPRCLPRRRRGCHRCRSGQTPRPIPPR